MPNFYIYFVSTLPALSFGAKPPLTMDKFLESAKGLIPDKDRSLLQDLRDKGIFSYSGNIPILRKWQDFNVALNNELVKIRAARKHIDAEKFLHTEGRLGYDVSHLVSAAHRKASPAEGEKALDEERWGLLDELCIGHYFDLEFLVVYMFKLMILERWNKIATADKKAIMDEVLTKD